MAYVSRSSLLVRGDWCCLFATIMSFTLLQSVIASRSLLFNVSFSLLVKKKGGVKRGGGGLPNPHGADYMCYVQC